jgi:vacuolar-type H+-ATPase subunit H
MKDIVSEILQVEKKVADSIQKARNKAAEIRQQSDRETAQALAEAREKARKTVQDAVDEAARNAELVREGKLREAEEKSGAIARENSDKIEGLVGEVVRLVIQTGYDGDGE